MFHSFKSFSVHVLFRALKSLTVGMRFMHKIKNIYNLASYYYKGSWGYISITIFIYVLYMVCMIIVVPAFREH